MQVPGSANLPPRPQNMLPEITPAKQAAQALKKLAGRSRSTGKAPHETGYILYLEDLTVSFDGFKAINDLTLYVETGELRCIIGPNGAGKTTMMDIITGKTRPDSGSAWFGQTLDLLAHTEPEIAQAGIGRKFQKPTVFEHHSAFENLELALAGNRGVWSNLFARLSSEQRDRIERRADPDRPGRRGRYAGRQTLARPEAMAGDRHAADAEPAAAAGGRTGGRA